MGSTGIAAFIGFWAFWVLLIVGYAALELSRNAVAIFLALWLAGRFGLALVPWQPAHFLFPAYVAVLDIALVLVIFEGDVPLR